MKNLLMIFAVLNFCTVGVLAQGGKAEPRKINFAKGKSSAVLTGNLKNNQIMEYVFAARKGQKISLKVTSIPKGNFFDFSFEGDGFEIERDLDAYDEYDFIATQTGNYLIFLRKRPTDKIPQAKFYFTVSVR